MSDVETYDCTSGGARYCMGCYTMTLSVGMDGKPDHYGNWVKTTAHDAAIAAKDAEIERLRAAVSDTLDVLKIFWQDAAMFGYVDAAGWEQFDRLMERLRKVETSASTDGGKP